ncbi:MAG TPA: acyclic terpene utilization AtuA family protein, partial [Streptosporangiaceae bacterium]|nr:acyclic terpene utilization AtuA family protein [Streptosporangiaceae bacterium]
MPAAPEGPGIPRRASGPGIPRRASGTTDRPVRIGNFSGFYGDRLAAASEMAEGGPVDVVTGDYLAELTMAILWKARQKDPAAGYARTFLTQLEQVLGTCLDRGIRIVVNAGGLNPAGLAAAAGQLAGRLGLAPAIAYLEGDDLLGRIPELLAAGVTLANADTGQPLAGSGAEPVTANAYLGGWGIAEALAAGADLVICPRVTDASLAAGPAAWWHGWRRDDWDRLAG